MKIIFNRNQISAAVSPLMCAVANKSLNPAIDGILIDAREGDVCVLTTWDESKGVRTTIEATVIEPGFYIVNAQKFTSTLRVMEGDEVTLTVDGKLTAVIESGASSYKMSAMAGENFPPLPDLVSDRSFTVSEKAFKDLLSQVSFAMAQNDQRAMLNGTCLTITDDAILAVACDGIKLAKSKRTLSLENKNTNGNAHLDYTVILPTKTVADLMRLLGDDEEPVQIYVTRKYCIFLLGELTFFSKLIEEKYIDYDRIIPKNHKIFVTVEKDHLVSALERAALVTEEHIAGSVRSSVRMNFTENTVVITAESASAATHEELAVEKEGEDLVIAFNNRFLIDSIKAVSTEKLRISLSTALSSVNLEPVDPDEGTEELFMVLPVRTKD